MPATCHAGANEFIERWFHDCVYNARDMVGFLLGMTSIGFWMVAQIPQLVANYRTKRADALSAWFLAEWLLGDTFNLLGCLLKGDELPTVVFTAEYFICMDAVLLLQYVYYRSLQRRRERVFVHRSRRRHHWREEEAGAEGAASSSRRPRRPRRGEEGTGEEHTIDGESLVSSTDGARVRVATPLALTTIAAAAALTVLALASSAGCTGAMSSVFPGAGRRLLGEPSQDLHSSIPPDQVMSRVVSFVHRLLSKPSSVGYEVGVALGYASSVLYLLSRVSQIYRNAVRRSAEGLALTMFFVAAAANTTYGGAILVRSYTWSEVVSSLPWLIGSLGTVALDVFILCQAAVLNKEKKARRAKPRRGEHDLEEPLLLGHYEQDGEPVDQHA